MIPATMKGIGNDSATLFKLGTQYKYSPDGMLYLAVSARAIGSAARTACVPPIRARCRCSTSPTSCSTTRSAIKSQWLDRRLTLNVSVFLMKWKDIQLESKHAGGEPWWVHGTINGGAAESKGVELSMAARATRGLSFDLNLTAADPKLTEAVRYPNPDRDPIPAGTPMVGAPQFKSSLGVEYNFQWKPMQGELWARFEYSHQSYEYQSLRRAVEHTLHGRVLPWDFGKLLVGLNLPSKTELTLTVDNIWNSSGSNWVSNGEEDYAAIFGDPRYYNMQARFRPQNIGLTIRKSF